MREPDPLPNRVWNDRVAREKALCELRAWLFWQMNQTVDGSRPVHWTIPLDVENVYRSMLIDNHDPGDEDGSER